MNRILRIVILALFPAMAAAQPLADRVPADAMVYWGWHGTTDVPGFSGSHFEAVLKESNLPVIFRQVLPGVITRIGREDAEAGRDMQLAYDIIAPMMKYPTAFYFAGLEFDPERRDPMPRMGIICRAGAESAALQEKINGLLDQARDFPGRLVVDGDDIALVIGYGADVNPLAAESRLAADGAFKSAASKVQSNAVVFLYADIEKIFGLIDGVVERQADPQEREQYTRIVDILGVRGLKRFAASSAFDGQDFMSAAFLEAPEPRAGILRMLESPAVTDDLLKAIPADAEFFAAGSLDIAKLLTEVREIAGQIDPEAQKMFDQGLGAATMALGRNIQTELFEPMGPHWAAYSAPSVAGGGILGLTLVNKADDAAKLKGGMMSLSIFVTNTTNMVLAQEDAPFNINGRQVKYGDLAINYLATPLLTPCWAVQGDYLAFGLYPQTLIGASRHLAGGKSIVEEPGYQKLRERLGVKDVRAVSYINLPASAPDSYGLLLLASRVVGFADLFGVNTPPIVLPPLHVLQEHLAPAGSITWVDESGVHMRHICPFPGAELLGGAGMAPMIVGMTGLQAAILVPSLSRARESADRVKSASNLRQIGLASMLYANENNGRFPDDLRTIVLTQDLAPEVFASPRTGTDLRVPDGTSRERMAEIVAEQSDYIWLGAGLTMQDARPDRVIAYENHNRVRDGINLLYADGHVEFHHIHEAVRQIEASKPGN